MQSIEKLCKEMRDSNYDVSVLDSQPIIVKNTFIAASKLIADKKLSKILSFAKSVFNRRLKINQQLSTCIYNHYYAQQPIARKVSGIGEVSLLEYGDRKIYLFSDLTQSLDYSCETESMAIHGYLQKFFNTTDKFIDFYCEYAKKRRNIPDSYLNRAELEFRACSEGNVKPLRCPSNVRMHFTDPDLDNPLINFLALEDHIWTDERIFKYRKTINSYINTITDKSKFNAFLKNYIENSKILTKELGKVDSNIKNMILDSVYKYSFDAMTARIKDIDPIKTLEYFKYEVLHRSHVNNALFSTDDLYENFLYIASTSFASFMDIYTLARMFKKFDVSNSYDPEYAKNIIVYAGDSHIIFYRKFLLDFGYTEKYHKKYKESKIWKVKILNA